MEKQCRVCHAKKDETEFYLVKTVVKERLYVRRRASCKECRKSQMRQYYFDNKEFFKKQWAARHKHFRENMRGEPTPEPPPEPTKTYIFVNLQ